MGFKLKRASEGATSLVIGCVLAIVILGGARLFDITNAIQNERHALCTQQDKRHDDATKTLNIAIASIRKTSSANIAIIDAIAPSLINAIVPYQNCDISAPKG